MICRSDDEIRAFVDELVGNKCGKKTVTILRRNDTIEVKLDSFAKYATSVNMAAN